MNITEYVAGDNLVQIFHSKMTILQDYGIVNADELIYEYLGINSIHPITALIHPDDLDTFYDAVKCLKECRQHFMFRLRGCNNCYRYFYAVMKYNTETKDTIMAIDIEVMDVMLIYEKYKKRVSSVLKYRKIMSLSANLYLEYYYDKREINIFEYVNGRSIDLYRENIDAIYERVNHNPQYTSKQKLEFDVLYGNLVNYAENIDVTVDGVLLGIGRCSLKLNGGIMYRDDKKEYMVAVITKMDYADAEREEKYYLTSYAVDSATSAYNKRAISELAMDLLAKAGNKRHYLVMMDLDDFKVLNDTYGHMVGDDVLAKVADIMKSVIGDRGYVGRFGGDEFFVITDKMKDDEELIFALKTIRKHIAWCCEHQLGAMKITTSIGIAKYPEHGRVYEDLFKVADACLYRAKANGKNRYVIYNPEKHGELETAEGNGRFGARSIGMDHYQRFCDAYELIDNVRKQGVDEFDDVMYDLCQIFSIDGVSIYEGENLTRVYTYGNYHELLENASFLNQPEFQVMFDNENTSCVNKILSISNTYPDIYEKLSYQGISGYLMIRTGSLLISFDVFDRLRKWSETDKGLLMMIGRTMLDVMNETNVHEKK